MPAIAEEMVKACGVDSFGQVEAIRYTVHKDLPSGKVSRTWVWEPKIDTVSYQGPDKAGKRIKVTYRRGELGDRNDVLQNGIDDAFINHNYVFLFPLHVAWDDTTVSDEGLHGSAEGEDAGWTDCR